MLDFLVVTTKQRQGVIDIFPKFKVGLKTKDIMVRGGDFYAVYDEVTHLWKTSESDLITMVDKELFDYYEEHKDEAYFISNRVNILTLEDGDTKMIDKFHHYCQKQQRDNWHELDTTVIFADQEPTREDYASKKLPYSFTECATPNWDELINTLYDPPEKLKIEWSIGAIATGESKEIQKFMVMYGNPGTGKSTIMNVMQQLFDGYYAIFDAKALGSGSDAFALEAFKDNPLLAIQHDGDLSKIEDNTKLNSIISHETLLVNEKHKNRYPMRFISYLVMGTNKPVRITDSKSGIIRRLIDVYPSGRLLNFKDYKRITKAIKFELGGIACHCAEVYLANRDIFKDYIPTRMIGASNDFYNFMVEKFDEYLKNDGTTLQQAWSDYNDYIAYAGIPYKLNLRSFKEELRSYFEEFHERSTVDGTRVWNYYHGFKSQRFQDDSELSMKLYTDPDEWTPPDWLKLIEQPSVFDICCSECISQYASVDDKPLHKWSNVRTLLCDLDTSKVHYVRVPEEHIVIDFDLKDEDGNKSLERNLKAASEWPPTYAEVSKGGNGLHLHYIWTGGDVSKLQRIFSNDIEVKVFTGNSSLRRRLSLCNNIDISELSSGLPLKEEKMINFEAVTTERALRQFIVRNLHKEYLKYTAPSISFIYDKLEQCYASGMSYDVSDLKERVIAFAAQSSHQADTCLGIVSKMKFKSEEEEELTSRNSEYNTDRIIFFDVEVFSNLFVICWKFEDEEEIHAMINPSRLQIEYLLKYKLVGFNNRKYDNHIVYAAYQGYSPAKLYRLSQKIIGKENDCFIREAYNISFTDIYDFAAKKQSLKKWEIELGIHHQELGLPWDEPVPEELWDLVADYCKNDVAATEAVWKHLQGDFKAREILASIANGCENDTTNTLTTRFIFEGNKEPQSEFNYRDLAETEDWSDTLEEAFEPFVAWDGTKSKRPCFPGYSYAWDNDLRKYVSTYRGEQIGEGGYVYAEPGIYDDVALIDVASMHPHSILAEELFGEHYTQRFYEILHARICIKHKDFEGAKQLLNGALAPYLDNPDDADALAQALKIAINSVYGLTSAKFKNPFKDDRNCDNIVAKRGELFMIDLKHKVQELGFTVAHIKTDSIKVPHATPEIIKFIVDFGHKYGYSFEHEATYDRMCLVNDAVYIARYALVSHCSELYGEDYVMSSNDICKDNKKYEKKFKKALEAWDPNGPSPKPTIDNFLWTATGTQFQVPYVFKTLFSHTPITFADTCEAKSVQTALYLDMNENLEPGQHDYVFIGKTGSFCPISPGCGGGELMREKDGKYSNATGCKGWRWLEAETVQRSNKEADIDMRYYYNLANDAIDTIEQYGSFDEFVKWSVNY